jgi:TctA family transporter
MIINDQLLALLVPVAQLCAYCQIVVAVVLTVVAIILLVKVKGQQQYWFMAKLLALILVITISSIAIVGVNALAIKNIVDRLDVDVLLAFLNCLFWISAFLCVWLIAFKYHEQSRQMLRIEKIMKIRKKQLEKSSRNRASSNQVPEIIEVEDSIAEEPLRTEGMT